MKRGGKRVPTHAHVFRKDTRPEWAPGYYCEVCGWRIPATLFAYAIEHGAKEATGPA